MELATDNNLVRQTTGNERSLLALSHGYTSPSKSEKAQNREMERGAGVGGVSVLFVAKDSIYKALGCDCYDAERNALTYIGNAPVVAHPPCSRWSRLARFCEVRHGLKVGADGGCFEAALRAVRTWGGVIEHPAFSKAWAHFGLPRPDTKHQGWTAGTCGGYSCYIEQGRYGHPVKKATWLYVFGVPGHKLPELRWGHTPDSRGAISKNQDWRGGMDKWRDATGHREANATPIAFARALLSLAGRAAGVGVGLETSPADARHSSEVNEP